MAARPAGADPSVPDAPAPPPTREQELLAANDALHTSHAAHETALIRLRLANFASSIGTWAVNRTTGQVVWDAAMYALFGVTPPLDLDTPLPFNYMDRIHPADQERVWAEVRAWRAGTNPGAMVYRITRPDGAERWVKSAAHLVIDDAGTVLHVVGSCVDVTEEMAALERQRSEDELLRRLNAELEQRVAERTLALSVANRQLEYSAHIKDEFMATMSYELRNPLTNILEANSLLVEMAPEALNPQQQRFTDVIRDSSEHLLQLISSILDFSRIQAGTLELDLQPVHVELIYRPALRMIRTLAAHKDLAIAVNCVPPGIELLADPRRLKQMLINLLDNAVKFTLPGGQIGLDVVGDAQAGVVRFTVWDTGIGIDPADQAQLFQAFTQVKGGLSRTHRGIGLGLALTQQLAVLHHGSMSVESAPAKGARFTITLPWQALYRRQAWLP